MVTSPRSLLSLLLLVEELVFFVFLTFLSVVVNWYSTSAIAAVFELQTNAKLRRKECIEKINNNDRLVNDSGGLKMTVKDEFSNASRQQESPVETANIAFWSKRRVQCTGLGVHSGRTYSTRKSIFKKNPNENFGQETRSIILISLHDVYHSYTITIRVIYTSA